MKFKLDENFSPKIEKLFKEHGYESCTVLNQGLCSSSDNQIFKICQKEKYCLVTLDKHFANILNFPPQSSHGIIFIRLPKRPTTNDIDYLIKQTIKAAKNVSFEGKLWIVEPGRIREYQYDI